LAAILPGCSNIMSAKVEPGGIALFGGTFDPVHIGHCIIAQRAMEEFSLKKVVFIPCHQSPHKLGVKTAASSDRIAMLREALAGSTWAEVSDFEIAREQPSFSVDTAESFSARHPGVPLFWIMGTDQWEVLEKWKNYRRLAELVTFIIFPRPGVPKAKKGIRHLQLESRVDISASMVRELIRKGRSFHFFVPQNVHTYIRENNLYAL